MAVVEATRLRRACGNRAAGACCRSAAGQLGFAGKDAAHETELLLKRNAGCTRSAVAGISSGGAFAKINPPWVPEASSKLSA